VIAATYARYNGQRNWRGYRNLNSNVHDHVYGLDVVKNGRKIHEPGYLDLYRKWGGK
jgi:hypothetical protein